MRCRNCKQPLAQNFVDLGHSPPSNAYLRAHELLKPEKWYPLRLLICEGCYLVQTEDFVNFDEMFSADYAYFSSFSSSWLAHCEAFTDEICQFLKLDKTSFVVEAASNDGYLLKNFKKRGIKCLGIEPTKSTAEASIKNNIETIQNFFTKDLAHKILSLHGAADLMIGNNVLAHVPDLDDFLGAYKILLKPEGVISFEFPHLLQLLKEVQFDTIYHEHFSYFSLNTVIDVLSRRGLYLFDVEELPTHGGSLRIFVTHAGNSQIQQGKNVARILEKEKTAGLMSLNVYSEFSDKVFKIKDDLLYFLIQQKRLGKRVCAYGAAAKGNTFFNLAGIRPDLVEFVADRNHDKQDKFLPGSRIPILDEQHLREMKPDYVLILPWNLAKEIGPQLSYVRKWGGKLVTAIPNIKFLEV